MVRQRKTIMRRGIREVEVEVPSGHVPCPYCKGQGRLSAYDRGATSLFHDGKLAALEECEQCNGQGYIPLRIGGE